MNEKRRMQPETVADTALRAKQEIERLDAILSGTLSDLERYDSAAAKKHAGYWEAGQSRATWVTAKEFNALRAQWIACDKRRNPHLWKRRRRKHPFRLGAPWRKVRAVLQFLAPALGFTRQNRRKGTRL